MCYNVLIKIKCYVNSVRLFSVSLTDEFINVELKIENQYFNYTKLIL